ncbi:PREDICTED: autophagy protein 5-like [Amphimedon queenslandica]|uniref:Autophagy protein 5 n=1 Tax=Amphimedon queenslandica TaxID=400682 RepID=A0A1X7UQG1_AMPQE|nr:PREDICTED: autophagy protein 5-like [Amphimedon queenslandica]|eukprot:XP_019852942.1 PREDICTED: autophagy protein 5-like [Amphimedon queenslandica]
MSDMDQRREVWDGKVPVSFILSQQELQQAGGTTIPEPVFMLLPRVSYFPLVYDKLVKLYARAVSASLDDKIWLSYGPSPLKWHYPVGILFDLFARSTELPWEITVHFKDYPTDDILIYEGKEALEGHFLSKLKEADWLKHGAKVIQQFTPSEFGKLWQSISQHHFEDFWSVNQKLMLNIKGEMEPFKFVPFSIYREGKRLYQGLIASQDTTFGDVMNLYQKEFPSASLADHQFLLHGIEIPAVAHLQWVSEHLSYPDNFLHIVLTRKT